MDRVGIEHKIALLANELQNDYNVRIFFFRTALGAVAVNSGQSAREAATNAGLDWQEEDFSYWSLSDILEEGLRHDSNGDDSTCDESLPFAELVGEGDGQPSAGPVSGVADPT